MSVYYGASEHTAKRERIIRDLITGEHEPTHYARHRVRAFLTPLCVRMRVLDELAHIAPQRRERIMRRKLTLLDRSLTDRQAAILDRAFNAWLSLNGKSKSVNPEAVGGGNGESKLPLTVRELKEAHAFSAMKQKLEGIWKARLEALFTALAPWREERSRKLSDAEIGLVVNLSQHVLHAYEK